MKVLNLTHDGVLTKTFVELVKETLDAEVLPLTEWTMLKAMLLL